MQRNKLRENCVSGYNGTKLAKRLSQKTTARNSGINKSQIETKQSFGEREKPHYFYDGFPETALLETNFTQR